MRAHRDHVALRHAEEAVGEAGLVAPSDVRNHGNAVLLKIEADRTVHVGVRLLQAGGLPYHHTAIRRDDAIKFLQQRKITARGRQHTGKFLVVHIEMHVLPEICGGHGSLERNHVLWNLCVAQIHQHRNPRLSDEGRSLRQIGLESVI